MTDQDFMVKVQERFPGHTITFPDAPLGPDDIVLRRGIAVDGRTIKVRWNNDVVDTVFQRHGLSIDDEVVEILCEAIQQSLSDPNFISEDRRTLQITHKMGPNHNEHSSPRPIHRSRGIRQSDR